MRMRKRSRQAVGGSLVIADAEVMVRRSSIAACVTCGLCSCFLRHATAISECLHAFCRECIVDEFNRRNTSKCPKCGTDLGCNPLEKLRPDHNLESIGLMIFPSKRCKFEGIATLQPALGDHSEAENLILTEEHENKRAGKTAAVEKTTILEGTSLAPVPSDETHDTEVEMEVVDETLTSHGLNHEFYVLDLAPVGRGALAQIRCRDLHLASSLSAEAGALIVWQPPSIQRGISYDKTASRQSQLTPAAPVHNQIMVAADQAERWAKSQTSAASTATVLATSGSSHVRSSVQNDENLRGELLSIYNNFSEGILQRIEAHIRQSLVYKEVARLEEELEKTRLEKSAASERARVLEEKLQDQTERSQELLQENRALKSDIFKKNEELTNLKHNNDMIQNRIIEVEQRNTVLENRMNHVNKLLEAMKLNSRKLNEQLRKAENECESKRSEKKNNEAAWRELLGEYRAMKSEIAKKDEELTNLKHDSIIIENINADQEEQIDHVNRLLGEEKMNSRKLNEQLRKAIEEKNKLMAELEICNDAPGRIHGAIRGTLSAAISGLRNTKTITKAVHYEDLLSRMDDLELVQGHLPKIWETIKIATNLSAYGAVSVVFARLLSHHGDNFDIQRLLVPVHLSDQHFGRIRSTVEPQAVEVAQKYGLKYAD